jgi:hypothetical protein
MVPPSKQAELPGAERLAVLPGLFIVPGYSAVVCFGPPIGNLLERGNECDYLKNRVCWCLASMLMMARPMSISAATPDPVLEWIGIMNDTVLAAELTRS